MCNKINLIEEYEEFITHQNFVCGLICKPKSQKKKTIWYHILYMIKENKKTNNSYNTLLKVLNIKNKQFQQVYYNSYLREQNVRVLQSKEYNINKCQELIKKSTNEKLKQQFQTLMCEVDKVNTPIKHKKLVMNIIEKSRQINYIYTRTHIFTMKIIRSRGRGKTVFLIA